MLVSDKALAELEKYELLVSQPNFKVEHYLPDNHGDALVSRMSFLKIMTPFLFFAVLMFGYAFSTIDGNSTIIGNIRLADTISGLYFVSGLCGMIYFFALLSIRQRKLRVVTAEAWSKRDAFERDEISARKINLKLIREAQRQLAADLEDLRTTHDRFQRADLRKKIRFTREFV